ncbi:hypothetical protein KY328_05420 [Candidatus Woesearchaeota archaeon]|nr:hypothetical protein [Candidatus Woesearchaeota archaeon]MBW3022337.1 hypothetical protein [Candidatus Woesearchaeota archaeon]
MNGLGFKISNNNKPNSRKAQMQTHLLIYIVAIVLVALILIFGYRAVRTFIERGQEAEFVTLRSDLQRTVNSVAVSFGDVRIEDYSFPPKYSKVCLLSTANMAQPPQSLLELEHPLIYSAVAAGSESNMFLVDKVGEPFADIGNIKVQNDFQCFELVDGKLRLRFDWAARGLVNVRGCSLNDPNCAQ